MKPRCLMTTQKTHVSILNKKKQAISILTICAIIRLKNRDLYSTLSSTPRGKPPKIDIRFFFGIVIGHYYGKDRYELLLNSYSVSDTCVCSTLLWSDKKKLCPSNLPGFLSICLCGLKDKAMRRPPKPKIAGSSPVGGVYFFHFLLMLKNMFFLRVVIGHIFFRYATVVLQWSFENFFILNLNRGSLIAHKVRTDTGCFFLFSIETCVFFVVIRRI